MTETVVITGANRGLGLALATACSARGDHVIAGCRDPRTAADLAAVTGDVFAVDMGDESSIARFVDAVTDRVGGGAIDIVVNNAGIDARNLGAADSERNVLVQRGDHVLGQVAVNAVGPMLLARGLVDLLRRSDRPRIVNMSSQIGSMQVASTIGSDVGYAVSKAALNMITIKFSTSLRDDGITAVVMHPGHLRTDMGGPGGAMAADDAAGQITELIDRLTLDDTGSFLRWDGTTHPW
ncbi:MAG: SDR family oxidoreductase [Ilumatobacteraceae bacterium]